MSSKARSNIDPGTGKAGSSGKAGEALFESEMRFREMAAANRQVFWMRDVRTGAMLYVSPAFSHLYGRPIEKVMSDPETWVDAIHPDDRNHAEASYRRSFDEGVETVDQFRIVRPDKSIRWVEAEIFPIFENDQLVRLTGNVTDITGRYDAEEEARLMRSLVAYSNDGIFILRPDDDFRLVFINEAGQRHFRRSLEELVQMKIWDWDPHFSREESLKAWERIKEAGSITFETDHLRGDGTTVRVEITSNYLRHGTSELIAGVIRDISARAEAEAVLRENEEKFRVMFNEAADALFIIDSVAKRITDCNDRALEIFDAANKEDLLGDCHKLFPAGRFAEKEIVRICEQVESGGRWAHDIDYVSLQGRPFWGAVALRKTSFGERSVILARVGDITERRRLLERLREQAMLLDEANDAIVLRALDQTIEFWSCGAENLFGWSREEARGRKATDLHFRDMNPGEEAMLAVISEGIWTGEVELYTKSGRKVVVESRWTLIRDSSGTPRAILDLSTDVTEKRRVEAGMLRAQRLESIGSLAGGIAHDLNNILAPIILSSDMLKSRVASDEDRELVESVGESARRGADVVRQILSFAQGADSTRVPLNVRHLFPEIRKIVSETFPKNIKCRTQASPDLWTISADPTQLHQVLLNLCLNGRDAMPDGGTLRLEASNVEIDSTFAGFNKGARPGPYVKVTVSDTGTGIPEEVRDQIFNPFFTTKPAAAGVGLGLSTFKAIVRAHGGFLQVETEVGKGTSFTFHLPAEAKQVSAHHQREKSDLPRGNGELILVIDDEKSIGSITRQSLESAGYRAIVASDGADGVSLFVQNQEQIALVLTDMMMPVMNGSATIKAIHRIAPETKIIAMSGVANTHGSLAGSSPTVPSDVVNFLLKPFTLESLLLTVQEALEK